MPQMLTPGIAVALPGGTVRFQRIVVGIDFSPYSETAREHAFQLAADSDGSRVFLVHAFEDTDYHGQESWLLEGQTFHDLLEHSRELARNQLEQLAEQKPPNVTVQVELSDMDPDTALVDASERHKADLVIIGTHGRTGLERLTLARNTERVVRNTPCSVLVARPSKSAPATPRRILVPTDFSEDADRALSVACGLVADGGRVDVLHCWLVHFYPTGYHGLYQEAISMEPALADAIRKQGHELLQRHSDAPAVCHFEETFSSPVSGIQDALDHTTYDLVVMGSHSRHGVKRLLLGSTAEATVRHANCSVLVVRGGPQG